MVHDRITVDPLKMAGEPCIRGMRMPVSTVVRLLGEGWTEQEILDEWDNLELEDIRAALRFAAEASRVRSVVFQN